MDERKIIQIDYTNWRGERRVREILPTGHLEFSNTEYHHDSQWLLEAVDVEDGKIKLFAMKDIHSFGVTERASPWRDIESAPKDGTAVVGCSTYKNKSGNLCYNWIADGYFDERGDWYFTNSDFAECADPDVTDWMPLPEPPR